MAASRPGKSLLELLLVVAILALLLSAVQKVRLVAARLRDENRLRQVALAAHGYQAQNGRLPPLVGVPASKPYHDYPIPAAAFLLPHLEQSAIENLLRPKPAGEPDYLTHVVPAYVSSLDPSHDAGQLIYGELVRPGVGNVAFNAQVFGPQFVPCGLIDGKADLTKTFRDGTTNTVLLATKRGKCGQDVAVPPDGVAVGGSRWASTAIRGHCPAGPNPARLTVAAVFGHAVPAADGTGPTFQVMPGLADCDPELAQGFHAGGVSVGMADGSVRTVRAGLDAKLWRAGLLPGDGDGLPAE